MILVSTKRTSSHIVATTSLTVVMAMRISLQHSSVAICIAPAASLPVNHTDLSSRYGSLGGTSPQFTFLILACITTDF